MNIVDKCFPDIQQIDETIELYKESKYAYIKQEILSGKHDERLMAIMHNIPLVPLLFLSGFDKDPVMEEGNDLRKYNFNKRTFDILSQLYGEAYAHHWIKFCINNLEEEIWEVTSEGILIFKDYPVCLFKEEVNWDDDYTYTLEYYSVRKLTFLQGYWLNLLTKHKDDFKIELDTYLSVTFYEDGEELVDLDDL